MILKDYKEALSLLMSKVNDKDHETEKAYNVLNSFSDTIEDQYIHNRLLLENMSDVFWIIDLEGNLIFINKAVKALLGYEPQEMIGRKLYEFMCPLHVYNVGTCKACVASMKDIIFDCQEMWMVHKDQKTRKVLEVNSNHIFKNNELFEIQGIGRDITSRIQYQRRMKKKDQQMGIVQDLSNWINQSLSLSNLNDLLEDTCKNIVKTMHVDLCSVFILEDNRFIIRGSHGKNKTMVNENIFKKNPEILDRIYKEDKPFVVFYDKNTGVVKAGDNLLRDMGSMVIMPLKANRHMLGVLVLVPGNNFEEDHLPLYGVLGNNIAFACEKSKLYQKQKNQFLDIIMTLVAAMEAKDAYTQGHSIRVSEYAVRIGQALGLSKDTLEELKVAGILHDIGKFGVVNNILTKPGQLSFSEYEEIKKHPEIGIKILERIQISDEIKDAILYHHLREDLKGYPYDSGLTGLPLFAKIIGAADALDAMTSFRTYKAMMTTEDVINEFKQFSGSQFDREISDVVISLLENNEIVPFSNRQS